MQKSKNLLKTIFIYILAIIFCLSPVFMSGCGWTKQSSGGSSGGSGDIGGGSSGGESGEDDGGGEDDGSDEEVEDDFDPQDYFNGFKFSYRPANGNVNEFITAVKNQNAQVASQILQGLYKNYGAKVSAGLIDDLGGGIDAVTVTYSVDDIKKPTLTTNKILHGNNPLFSTSRDGTSYVAGEETANAYEKYFSYENAMTGRKENVGGSEVTKDAWNGESEFVFEFDGENIFLTNSINQLKLQLAILLITSDYDISIGGKDRQLYLNEVDEMYLIANNYPHESQTADFYQAVNTEIFAKYEKVIEHSGFTSKNTSAIIQYVYEDIIGMDNINLDEKRYVNDYIALGDYTEMNYFGEDSYPTRNGLPADITEKYNRYLSDDNFLASYVYENLNGEPDINLATSNGQYLYNYFREFVYDTEALDEFVLNNPDKPLNDITLGYAEGHDLIKICDVANKASLGLLYVADSGEPLITDDSNTTTIYNSYGGRNDSDVVVYSIFNNYYDLDGDGKFNYNVHNFGNNGVDKPIIENINGTDYLIYSTRLQYFKNYKNTVEFLVKGITEGMVYVEAPDGGMVETDDLTYPRVPSCYYANYTCGDILENETDDVFHMSSGYQNYQNMVFMPKKAMQLNNIILFIESNNAKDPTGNGIGNFNIDVYLRYYDAETNSYATWGEGENETIFYKVGTAEVEAGLEEDYNYIEIETGIILPEAKINGTAKNNCIIPVFTDPIAFINNWHNAAPATPLNEGAKYYEYVLLPDGNKVICYSGAKSDPSERSSYMELIFSTAIQNQYQISVGVFDIDEINNN